MADDPNIPEFSVDLGEESWILQVPGPYEISIIEAFKNDGSELQILIGLEFPGRFNKSPNVFKVRILITPEGAVHVGDKLMRSALKMIQDQGEDVTEIIKGLFDD